MIMDYGLWNIRVRTDPEDWRGHAVSPWWRSWKMITGIIPNHRTTMILWWHCEIGYRAGWWHGSRRTADKKKSMYMLWDPSLSLSFTLTLWSVGAWGTRLPWVLVFRGIRRGEFRDAIQWLRMRLVWGLRKSRDASQPVNLSSVNRSWHVECLRRVVYPR